MANRLGIGYRAVVMAVRTEVSAAMQFTPVKLIDRRVMVTVSGLK